MNDCQNIDIRESLPELAHGALPESERARVQEHLDECEDCSAELVIIRAVRDSAPVATVDFATVDVARIVAAIPPYRRQGFRVKRVYLELAAACLIGAIGISTVVVHHSNSLATSARANGAGANGARAGVVSGARIASPGLALVNTSELSDSGLAQLTQDLDKLQAMPTSDPESVTPAALERTAEPGIAGDSA